MNSNEHATTGRSFDTLEQDKTSADALSISSVATTSCTGIKVNSFAARNHTITSTKNNNSRSNSKHKSICSLLRYFVDLEITVELKTGRMYKGILHSAEADMSVMLENVICVKGEVGRTNKSQQHCQTSQQQFRFDDDNDTEDYYYNTNCYSKCADTKNYDDTTLAQCAIPESSQSILISKQQATDDDDAVETTGSCTDDSNIKPPSSIIESTITSSSILMSLMQIRGSMIRYIHFPSTIDLSLIVKNGIDRERSASQKYKRGLRK